MKMGINFNSSTPTTPVSAPTTPISSHRSSSSGNNSFLIMTDERINHQTLQTFESKLAIIEAIKTSDEDRALLFPSDNITITRVNDEHPKALASTPSDKDDPNLQLYVKESLQYFSQPKVRVRKQYNKYDKDSLGDEKFSRKRFEVDVGLKKEKKNAGNGDNNFSDMTKSSSEKVDCDPSLIQDSTSDAQKLIKKGLSGRIMKTYDMSTSSVEYSWDGGAEKNICKRSKAKSVMALKHAPIMVDVTKFEPKLCEKFGELEPFFIEMSVFDLAKGKKISETFSCNVNTEETLAVIPTASNSSANNRLNRAIFHISQRTKDIVLLVQVSKILQGEEDVVLEPYLKPDKLKESDFLKLKKAIPDFCSRLSEYRQPVCWTVLPMFDENEDRIIIPPKVTQFYRAKGCMSDATFSTLFGNDHTGTQMKRLKSFPASLSLTSVQIPGYKPEYKQDGLVLVNNPEDDTLPDLSAIELFEFPTYPSLSFYEHFSNYLFVYPEEVNLSSRGFTSKSARNIAVRVELKEDDLDLDLPGIRAICGKACDPQLVECAYTKVSYHNRSPEFNDEFKIKLPTVLTSKHHLLFTYYHVVCQKGKMGNTLLGYSILPLLTDGRLVNGRMKYPLITEFSSKFEYLATAGKRTYIEGGKHLLQCKFRSESTVYPFDEPLSTFYQSLRYLGPADRNLDQLLQKSIRKLAEVCTPVLIQSLPQIFNQLMKIICTPSFPESQKTAFKTLLILCENTTTLTNQIYTSERNDLLEKYVDEKFVNYPNTESKLFLELPKLWLSVLEESGCQRSGGSTTAQEPADVKMTLNYSWMLFELIIKSMSLYGFENKGLPATSRKGDETFGTDVDLLFVKLVKVLSAETTYRARVGLNVAKTLNANIALFLRDLFDIMDRGFALVLVDNYLSGISKNPDVKHQEVLQEVRTTFLQIIVDYEHYVPMCLPLLDRKIEDRLSPSNHFLSGILIDYCMRDIVNQERVVRARSLNLLRGVLTKHEYDKRYQQADVKTKIASLYFPLMTRFLESFIQFSEVVSDKISGLSSVINKCKTEYDEKTSSYRTYVAQNIIDDSHKQADNKQEEQLQKMRDEEEQAKKKFEDATLQLAEEKKRIVAEKQNALITILYVFKNMDRKLLREWWMREMQGHVEIFLRMLDMCVEVFEYPGKKNIAERATVGIETSTTKSLSDAKTALESMYSSLDKRHRNTNTSAQNQNSLPGPRTRNFRVNRQTSNYTNSMKSSKNTMTSEKAEEIIKSLVFWEGNMNTETSLSILDVLMVFVSDLEEVILDFDSDQTRNQIFDLLFGILLKLLQTRQSDTTLVTTISLFKIFVRKFSVIMFHSTNSYSERLINMVLKMCHSAIEKIRTQASALLYFLIKINYETVGNFTRTKIQTTVALSNLATTLDQKCINTLRSCFNVIAQYAKDDKVVKAQSEIKTQRFSLRPQTKEAGFKDDRRNSLTAATFPEQVQELVERLGKTLTDTIGYSALENENADNEMKSDLLYRIANGYRHAPELSVTWFSNLAEQNIKNTRFVEAALCKVYIAAVVLQYMKMSNVPILQNSDYERLVKVSPALKSEKFEELKALFMEQERPVFQSRCFTREGLIELLTSAIQLFNEDSHFEHSIEIYKLFLQIHEAERNYKSLCEVHIEMSKLYDYISKSSIRLFGSYYRIYFSGHRLPEDIRNKAFIYKMPKIMRLSELVDYLKTHFGYKYGQENIEIVGESFSIPTQQSDKCYFQITSVKPYVPEIEQRVGFFENNSNISNFTWECPFTMEGKTHSNDLTAQYKRRTIVRVQEQFPCLMTRSLILSKEEVILTPVENSIEIIEFSIEKIAAANAKDPVDVNALHLVLTGTLIPQVNEGIPQIVRGFFGETEFDKKHITILKKRLIKMLICAKEGINKSNIHAKEAQRPLHEQIENGFKLLCEMIQNLDSDLFAEHKELLPSKKRGVHFS